MNKNFDFVKVPDKGEASPLSKDFVKIPEKEANTSFSKETSSPGDFVSKQTLDIQISKLVGLETYKALYTLYPNLYSYISDPLTPTLYFTDLVQGVIASSDLSFSKAGEEIYSNLSDIVKQTSFVGDKVAKTPSSYSLAPKGAGSTSLISKTAKLSGIADPLINSSYPVENLNESFGETVIWVTVVVFLSFFILFYLYVIGAFNFLINEKDGLGCTNCKSMFDYIV